jgi:hypothetical protein
MLASAAAARIDTCRWMVTCPCGSQIQRNSDQFAAPVGNGWSDALCYWIASRLITSHGHDVLPRSAVTRKYGLRKHTIYAWKAESVGDVCERG